MTETSEIGKKSGVEPGQQAPGNTDHDPHAVDKLLELTDLSAGRPVPPSMIEYILRVSDVLSILIAGIIVFAAVLANPTADLALFYTNIVVLGAILASMTIYSVGGYDADCFFNLITSFRRASFGWALTIAALLVVGFAFKSTGNVSRIWASAWAIGALTTLGVTRAVIWGLMVNMRSRKRFDSRVAIVGASEQGQRLYRFVRDSKWLTMRVIAFCDDRVSRVPDELDQIPVLPGLDSLVELIRRNAIDQVLVALPWSATERLREVIDRITETPIKVRLAPDMALFDFSNRTFSSLGGLPVLDLYDRPISGTSWIQKWLEDKILASLIILLVSPVLIACAIAIKLDSQGPVFFRQNREGFNNQTFRIWKFRTMRPESCEGDNIRQATKNDDRITKVGAFLRRTSLDELPQLFNVITGDMSLVGPRPHAKSTRAAGVRFDDAVKRYAARHRVKPGITGWAQVHGWRGETDTIEKLEARLRHDLYYIDNWSLGLDLYILIRTGLVVLGQKEAY
ncbi:undecaprenyl-phosphate glucose phosphotransferase [Gimibacter soli]|uniref:Undecaprenyl-phosphate glucose phosphotransferase n=1 Tax=Gimibacter soli TaxID=3024400 RepID=A0AAE9XNA4_9PROT|nr:undecaprenyl-phosphate glucose phosphotransferase [Gimibacter soli]WCL53182.1 undecaprenyl-phosphate glucose phosphotransferase [Gimibacter soli]